MSNKARRPKLQPPFGTTPMSPAEESEPPPELDFFGMAWRVFGLEADGTLVAPFVDRYWPGSPVNRVWQTETKNATCIATDHPAPVEDCSCGIAGVRSFTSFLDAVTTAKLADSPVPVIEECPVLARVRMSGRTFESTEPHDPPTTYRSEQVTVVAIHLGPSVPREQAQAIADRYRGARCYIYEPHVWPALTQETERVWPTPTKADMGRFLAKVRQAGFGRVDRRDLDKVAKGLGQDAVVALRGGGTPEDLASVLFDSHAKPTFAQARTLIMAAAEHLSPGLILDRGGYEHARPILLVESLARQVETPMEAMLQAGIGNCR